MLNKEHKPALAAFASYDAGLHTLPEEMVRRRAAVTRLQAMLDDLGAPPKRHDIEARLVRQLAEAACDDEVTLDDSEVADAVAATERHERQVRLLNLALSDAGGALNDAVHTYADEAIRGHLASALDRIVEDARKAAATYRKHGSTVAAMLDAPAAARTAYRSMDELAASFAAVRQTRYRLIQMTGQPQLDSRGDFALIKNAEQMWPTLTDLGRQQFQYQPPWHGIDSRALLEWVAENPDAVLWCPTAAEQDKRWNDVFGPRVAAMQANRHGSEALLAVMGGRS